MDDKKIITEYIEQQNYDAIVELGRKNNARTLRYVQMNIWGDYRQLQRWHAITALGRLAEAFAAQQDEAYRNVIRRAIWAMADESGNVPWAAPEMMTVVIKARPQQYREFVKIMITNGLDSPMCRLGVLWSIGYLGPEYRADVEPYMKKIMKLLNSKDKEVRGMTAWALKRIQYEPAYEKIESLADDDTILWIYEDGELKQIPVKQALREV